MKICFLVPTRGLTKKDNIVSIASFNTQAVKSHSTKHNNRERPPHYLLDHDCQNNEFKSYIADRALHLEKAEKLVKEKTGRSMQKSSKDSFWQEAVINILPDTKLEDIERLFQNLNQAFKGGFELSEIAIHKDEGVFISTDFKADTLWFNASEKKWIHKPTGKNLTHRVIAYAPNQDIFYDKKTKLWYFDLEYTKKAPLMQKYFNNHAHAIYNRLNYQTGKMLRLSKKDMTKLQDITAETLNMLRGKLKTETNNQRRNPHLLKQEYKYDNDVKRQQQEEIKQLRAELQKQQATREDYAILEQLNRELKEQIKSKDLTIESLEKQIEEFKFCKKFKVGDRYATKDEVIEYLLNENKELEEKIQNLKLDLDITKGRANGHLGLNKKLNNEVTQLKTVIKELECRIDSMRQKEESDQSLSSLSVGNHKDSIFRQ